MKIISSRDNPRYKEMRQLASSAQARKKTGKTILDGVHLCDAYFDHIAAKATMIVSETGMRMSEVVPLVARAEDRGTEVICLPDALYAALSQVENGVPVALLIDTPACAMPDRLHETVVLLDGVQDPGNLGSILRSAAAAEIQHVICGQGTVAAWSPKVLRAGMGAHFALNIYEGLELSAITDKLQMPLCATSSHTETTIYAANLARPVAWLFGHEGSGVSAELMQRADLTVTIPQSPKIESMNVAASAAVCFFEQRRQLLA